MNKLQAMLILPDANFGIKKLISTIILSLIFAGLYAQNQIEILEDFENNTRSWPIKNSLNYQSYFEDGNYYVRNKKTSDRYFYFQVGVNSKKDYTIELKVNQVSGSDQAFYGLTWGYASFDDHNDFLISSRGSKKVIAHQGGKEKILEPESSVRMGIIMPKEKPNILTLKKTKDKITYQVNGQTVCTSDDVQLPGKNIGFRAPKNVTVAIDYIKVIYEERTINLIENYKNGYKLENLGENINSEYSELVPIISPDGNTLYLDRRHPDNIGSVSTKADIWMSQKDANGFWSPLENMGRPLNNEGNNFVISATPDGNSLLVGNIYTASGSSGGAGVSIANKRNGKWNIPVQQKIKNFVNDNKYVNYFLTTDGTKLIMAIENEKSLGEQDLYVSFLEKNDTWGEPQHMGNVLNTTESDYAPFMAPDGKTLYFASYGHPGYGSSDVFVSRRLDDTWLNWSEPKNLGPEINSNKWEAYYCVSAKGDEAYMVSSNPGISLGKEDIFRIKIAASARPDPVAIIQGKVFNKKNNQPIEAEIFYENLTTHANEGKAFSSTDNGYKIVLPQGSSYGFRAKAKGFFAISENIDLNELDAFTEKEVNLYLIPIEKGQTFRLNNIFFDTNRANLREESFPELKRLLDLLKTDNSIKIEVAGHTDNQGTDANNLVLSNKRAKVVVDYLASQGISSDRLAYRGYGESKPIANNQTEQGRQLNRRVEFMIQ